ncbi:hypothetical protein BH11ARM2_BH11ARM2_17760 [soil metagenome]
MFEETEATVVAAHYNGERVVLDEPFDLHVGVPLTIHIAPRDVAAVIERRQAALDRIAELGRGVPPIDDKYILDRDTYYEDRP